MRSQKTGKGFTLIELLVVVTIIAVLIAILLPALFRAREDAKAVICATNEKNILTASLMYADENNGIFPGNVLGGATLDWYSPYVSQNWCRSIRSLLLDDDAYVCPSAPPYINEAAWGPGQLTPARPGNCFCITSYCNFRKTDTIRQPSGVIMFWETTQIIIASYRYPNGVPPGGDWPVIKDGPPINHNFKTNYAFPDGHVARKGPEFYQWYNFWEP